MTKKMPRFSIIHGQLRASFPEKPCSVRQALDWSIAKWDFIVQRFVKITDDGASDTCALCQLYIHNGCNNCPVKETTGKPECVGTPYGVWFESNCGDKSAAILELNFLKALAATVK